MSCNKQFLAIVVLYSLLSPFEGAGTCSTGDMFKVFVRAWTALPTRKGSCRKRSLRARACAGWEVKNYMQRTHALHLVRACALSVYSYLFRWFHRSGRHAHDLLESSRPRINPSQATQASGCDVYVYHSHISIDADVWATHVASAFVL